MWWSLCKAEKLVKVFFICIFFMFAFIWLKSLIMVKEKTLKSRNFNAICLWEHSGFTALRENLENQGKIWKIRENSGKIFKIYSVILRILSKYRKIRTRKNSNPSSNQGKTYPFHLNSGKKYLKTKKTLGNPVVIFL